MAKKINLTNTIGRTLLIASLVAGSFSALSAPVAADHNRYDNKRSKHYNWVNYNHDRPIKVYLMVEAGKRDGRRIDHKEAVTMDEVARRLPSYIRLVKDRARADLVLRAVETRYDVNFRITDRDREDKKYKDGRGYQGRTNCGPLIRAYYTEIKEKATARYAYDIKLRVRTGGHYGTERHYFRIDGKTSEDYRLATDLRAQTRCGIVPTHVPPSSKVARQLERSHPDFRRSIRREVRRETADEVGAKLARVIRQASDEVIAARAQTYAYRAPY